MAEPERGADAIDEELEVGFDQKFERRWHVWELLGRGFMALVVVAALAGLLGSGPFSHERVVRPAGTIAAVDYEPVARSGTPTQITLHLRPGDEFVRLRLSQSFAEPFDLRQELPRPALASAAGGGLELLVHRAPGGDALLRLRGEPSQIGPVRFWAQAGGDPPVQWTQVVLP